MSLGGVKTLSKPYAQVALSVRLPGDVERD